MSAMRVNFIHKGEVRYQGPVSPRFLIVAAILTPLLLFAMILTYHAVSFIVVKRGIGPDRAYSEKIHKDMEKYERVRQEIATLRRREAEAERWRQMAPPASEILIEIQRTVPASIRFTKLGIARSGPFEPGLGSWTFTLEGLAYGEGAESAVIDWRARLSSQDCFGRLFEDLRLVSMHRGSDGGADSPPVRRFAVIGKGSGMKGQDAAGITSAAPAGEGAPP
ncbi:hypothetical protein [Kiritimatiella glycovorans]|uniref:Fimbrial assembly protein (PilN) n=1 Tax=Kiritimatiella glycovorans TaxID=1307763 RepID=A0A0G3EHB7_9BACT|nr:hypothetical protein [Kiritimatiella glycovorans]AKJ63559.1 hypothetical protein L21SP4_00278 [Kiritimatiella glycovorans]